MSVVPFKRRAHRGTGAHPATVAQHAGGTAATPADSTSRPESAALNQLTEIAWQSNHVAYALEQLLFTLDHCGKAELNRARRDAKRELGEYKRLFEGLA